MAFLKHRTVWYVPNVLYHVRAIFFAEDLVAAVGSVVTKTIETYTGFLVSCCPTFGILDPSWFQQNANNNNNNKEQVYG